MSTLAQSVSRAGRWLASVYALDVELDPARCLIGCDAAKALLPEDEPAPRTGVLAIEQSGEIWLGLYVDPEDGEDPGTIVEETSHLLCLGWHAQRGLPVSALVLELQGEIDRFLYRRASGADPFVPFRRFRFADWLDAPHRARYVAAHQRAHRYCRALQRRFPRGRDWPALLAELRHFYRAGPEAKLRRAAARD